MWSRHRWLRCIPLRDELISGASNAVTRQCVADMFPSALRKYTMTASRTNRFPTSQLELVHRLHAGRPHYFSLGRDDILLIIQRPHFRLLPDQRSNGHSPSIRQANQRFPRHALSQVRHHRLLALALFHTAIQLRQGDHRAIDFLRQRLETARDLGDLGGAVLLGARHGHELQIVHDDEIQPMLTLDATRPRAQFSRRERRRVIDEDLGVLQLLGGAGDARPVVLGQLAAANIAQVHAAHRRQHARQNLLGRHFQRENGDRSANAFLERRMFGHVDGQRGLTHRRAARDDQQVTAT